MMSQPPPPPPPEDQQALVKAGLMSGTWNASSVMRAGTGATEDFDGFTLNFGDLTYSSTNGAPVWASSGSWAFNGDALDEIIVDGDRLVNLSLSTSALTLTFDRDEDVFGSRQKSVSVTYVFSLTR